MGIRADQPVHAALLPANHANSARAASASATIGEDMGAGVQVSQTSLAIRLVASSARASQARVRSPGGIVAGSAGSPVCVRFATPSGPALGVDSGAVAGATPAAVGSQHAAGLEYHLCGLDENGAARAAAATAAGIVGCATTTAARGGHNPGRVE